MQLLLDLDVDISSHAEQLCYMPALFNATFRGCALVMNTLLEAGADPDEGGYGRNFLFYAAFDNTVEILE